MIAKPWMSRKEAATWLMSIGCLVSVNSLARYASKGGGPAFQKSGKTVAYALDDLAAWAARRTIKIPEGQPVSATQSTRAA